MASNKITKKWDAELRRLQKERLRREASDGRRRKQAAVDEALRRTDAPAPEPVEAAQQA